MGELYLKFLRYAVQGLAVIVAIIVGFAFVAGYML